MKPTAPEILDAAAGHLRERAATYDKPEGERSMAATVDAFNTITNHNLTTEQGWLLMACLKMVRAQSGNYRADSYEDGAAYFALAGEAAAEDRGVTDTGTPFTHRADEADELYESEMDRLIEKHRIAVRARNLELKKGVPESSPEIRQITGDLHLAHGKTYHLQKGDYVRIADISDAEYVDLYTPLREAGSNVYSEDMGRFGWKYMGIDGTGGLRHWNIRGAFGPNATGRSREYILGATPKEEI
jgi:hypothetical protein